jgi:hypothetical protein
MGYPVFRVIGERTAENRKIPAKLFQRARHANLVAVP